MTLIGGVAVLIFGSLSVAAAAPIGTIAYTFDFQLTQIGPAATNGGIGVPQPVFDFPQFDPSLGSLFAVGIVYGENFDVVVTTGSTPGGGSGFASGEVFLAGIDYASGFSDGNVCDGYPPNSSGGCVSSVGITSAFNETRPDLYAAVMGNGTVQWMGLSFGAGYSGTSAEIIANGEVTLTYYYTPEPGTWSLVLLGLGVFCTYRKYRRSPFIPR